MQGPPIWQRLLAALAYLLPWSDALPFGQSLFGLFPVLQWLSLPAFPVLLLQQAVPFGGFVLFLVLFLAVVRNTKVPYLIRFNVLQAILVDILLILISLAFSVLLAPLGLGCWWASAWCRACGARRPRCPASPRPCACSSTETLLR
jgi:hypothetical protein